MRDGIREEFLPGDRVVGNQGNYGTVLKSGFLDKIEVMWDKTNVVDFYTKDGRVFNGGIRVLELLESDAVETESPLPENTFFMTAEAGGTKYDSGKPRMELLPHDALIEVAKVLTFGANKYNPGNWSKGIHYSRLLGAAQRHMGEFTEGRDMDPESQIHHIAHAACNLLFLLWMIKHRSELDDRWIHESTKTAITDQKGT